MSIGALDATAAYGRVLGLGGGTSPGTKIGGGGAAGGVGSLVE